MEDNQIKQIKEKFSKKILSIEEHSPRRIYLEIKPEDVKEVFGYIFDLGARFAIMTGVDTPKGIEILYHLNFDQLGVMVSVRAILTDKNKLEIGSITPILRGAEWIEREIWEMLGVNFLGHPNLKRLLLADDWPEGNYPLRRG